MANLENIVIHLEGDSKSRRMFTFRDTAKNMKIFIFKFAQFCENLGPYYVNCKISS